MPGEDARENLLSVWTAPPDHPEQRQRKSLLPGTNLLLFLQEGVLEIHAHPQTSLHMTITHSIQAERSLFSTPRGTDNAKQLGNKPKPAKEGREGDRSEEQTEREKKLFRLTCCKYINVKAQDSWGHIPTFGSATQVAPVRGCCMLLPWTRRRASEGACM